MKKKIALLLSAVMVTCSAADVLAAKDYIADREYVISEFIQAIGRNNFDNKHSDLTVYTDNKNISVEYREDMEIAVANNIVTGYEDNTLKPNNYITRAEAAVILSRCLGNVEITQSEKRFTDVPKWAADDVNKLTQGGIISGYDDTTFGSFDNITVQQVGILTDKVEEKVNKNNLKDDYFKYYNDKMKRNYTLENGRKSYDSFDEAEDILNKAIEEIIKNSAAYSDNNSKRISDVYNLYMDTDSRNAQDIEPLKPYIEKIDNMRSISDIPEVEAFLYKEIGLSPIFNFGITVNPENSSQNIIQLGETAVTLDRDHYFDLETDANKKAYYDYVTFVLEKTGTEKPSDLAKRVYDFEKSAIQKSGTTIYSAYGTVTDRNNINTYCVGIDAKAFLDNLVGNKGNKVSIYNSEQLSQMASLVSGTDIDVIKAYYKTAVVSYYASFLSENIVKNYYTFYNQIYGRGSIPSLEKRAVGFTKTYAGSALIKKYAEKYYDSSREQEIKNMIKDIKSYYKTKIENNTWLGSDTKAAAVDKLNKITEKIGYFKENLPYANQIEIIPKDQGGTLMDNVIRADGIISNYYISLPDTAKDKSIWAISPLMVNACYVPSSNEIIIPMAIMEKPFYDKNADYYENLGAIGSIIAHEISHAFDPMGAEYDAYGNRKDWWSESDKNTFYDLADKAVKYFGRYEVVNGIDNDGSKTLYENISDLSGLSCIAGIAGEQHSKTVMKSYARLWSGLYTDSYLSECVKSDVHSPSAIRVNAVLSSIDEFYNAYNISEGDGMYISPDERLKIW